MGLLVLLMLLLIAALWYFFYRLEWWVARLDRCSPSNITS